MNKSYIIRPLRISDSAVASIIHSKTIPGVSSQLGKSYLKEFYRTLIKNPKHIALAAQADKRVIGVIIATEDIAETSLKLHKLFTLRVSGVLFKKIITLQISPLTILARLKFEKYQTKSYKKPCLSIVTFCVDRAYQRHGIGVALIQKILKLAKKRHVDSIYVDTRRSNSQAMGFYLRVGFKEKKRIYDNIIFYKKI